MIITMDHKIGYVKFTDDNCETYFGVDIALAREWFHEFEISMDTFSDIGFEDYDGTIIVNYQPKEVLSVFKKLYTYVYFKIVPPYDDTNLEEQVEFIRLVCKLMTSDKISKIVEGIRFDKSLWLLLPNLDFDAKNYFNDDAKKVICQSIFDFPPKYDQIKFFNFYELYWFGHPCDVNITWSCFVRDIKNKCEYDIIIVGDKCVILHKKQYVYETKTAYEHSINVCFMDNITVMILAKPVDYKQKYVNYKNKYAQLQKKS